MSCDKIGAVEKRFTEEQLIMQKKPLMRAVIAWLVVIALLAAAPVPAGAERPESPAAEASTEQEFRKAFQSFMEKGI